MPCLIADLGDHAAKNVEHGPEMGVSETYPGCGKRLRDWLLDSIQDHHPHNRDQRCSDAAKKKSLHPQPPSIETSSCYTTPLGASKLVDRIKAEAAYGLLNIASTESASPIKPRD